MLCKELMVRDWCCDRHGFPMQITTVGDDYAYATFEGLEGDPWEFDDKNFPPCAIEITTELLETNGWDVYHYKFEDATFPSVCDKEVDGTHLEWKREILTIWIDYEKDSDGVYSDILVPCKYVHQLQQILRIAGMTDLANNFKI